MMLLACAAPDSADSPPVGSGAFEVEWSLDPAPQAGQVSQLDLRVLGPDGAPVPDLQRVHERYVHAFFISADFASFQRLAMEDFAPVGEAELAEAHFTFPVSLPTAGDYLLAFDFASQDQYRQVLDRVSVGGSPAMGEPVEHETAAVEVDGILAELSWDVSPFAGYEAAFTLRLSRDGETVDDVVPWLGADGHASWTDTSLGLLGDAHAWVPDMESVAPDQELPHLYDGPELPFHPVFSTAGRQLMWLQLATGDAPDSPHVFPFQLEVSG